MRKRRVVLIELQSAALNHRGRQNKKTFSAELRSSHTKTTQGNVAAGVAAANIKYRREMELRRYFALVFVGSNRWNSAAATNVKYRREKELRRYFALVFVARKRDIW